MRKAYSNLTSNSRVEDFDIETTELYVRFLPADSLELQTLLGDTSQIFWDYPLDFEVEFIGHYYHDPSIPDSLPTYQYTVVKPDFQFPEIEYQILAELFLPENYANDDENSGNRIASNFLDELEYEALRITGNLDEDEMAGNGRINASKWRPTGYVRVEEVSNQSALKLDQKKTGILLPVVNVLVKGKNWFHLSKDYTDVNGYYELDRYKGKVDYKIEFESDRVKITNFLGWSRNHNGPNESSNGWNPVFSFWTESWANATLINAAYQFRVQVTRRGMQTPFPTTWWGSGNRAVNKLNVRIKYDRGTGRMISPPWTINEIKIWSDFPDEPLWTQLHKGTDFLYSVAFHELAHSMHSNLDGTVGKRIITESWGNFIEYYFTREYYLNVLDINRYPNFNSSNMKSDGKYFYTPIFIDLMDDDNQLARLGGDRPNDNVRNYTFLQLQASLEKNRNLREVRDHLKGYTNSTRNNIDELFSYYINLESQN